MGAGIKSVWGWDRVCGGGDKVCVGVGIKCVWGRGSTTLVLEHSSAAEASVLLSNELGHQTRAPGG